ncbi:hypothetical protein [Parvularcula lutaonensis]|uniref:Uncharacterized protein n=1 Tax=Parvularcula lutaonensis TaxID=491923 RepID=A0ABV7MGL1_9PROT|nr:hypothetical protein [Parvularcula lutaonensis]GGY54518.1 hypothetical protein GCM10007148_25210 [Parvularcula lutaonensis]
MMLKVGDTYAFSDGERNGKAMVCVIGEAAETEIVCFYVYDALDFGDEAAKAQGFSGVIAHVPITSQYAVQGLGEKLSEGNEIPESFKASHEQWKQNLRAGQGGWSDRPLAATLDQIFANMNPGKSSS